MDILEINNDKEILECFSILEQLIGEMDRWDFLSITKRKYKVWYKLIVLKNGDKIVSLIWVRPYEYYWCWKFLVVDDFVTDISNRNQWYWWMLFDWIINYAKSNNFSQIQLDSNIKLKDAHRFYIKNWLTFSHKHFSIEL